MKTYYTAGHDYPCQERGCSSSGFAGVLETGKWKFKTLAEARRAGKKRPADARKGSKVRVTIEHWAPYMGSKFLETRTLVEKFKI